MNSWLEFLQAVMNLLWGTGALWQSGFFICPVRAPFFCSHPHMDGRAFLDGIPAHAYPALLEHASVLYKCVALFL